jgi:putative ABC transport system permease protein
MSDTFLQDLRYAIRSLLQRPGFTLVATLTLALGIGANSAIFSVLHGVLLRPLPYADPAAIVLPHTRWSANPRGPFSLPEYFDLREQTRALDRVGAYSNGTLTLTGAGEAERLRAGYVTADALPVLGVAPVLGRGFTAEEDAPGRPAVVVLGDGLWRRRFGGDPAIVGRTLTLDDIPTTVIGIMPPGFQLPSHYAVPGMELWTLLQLDPATNRSERGGHWLEVVGRLHPGLTVEAADREVAALVAGMVRQYPYEYRQDFGGFAVPAMEESVGRIRPVLVLLMGAVGLLLLIACANVASLLLARAEARQREIAVRAALGARSGRLVRQLLTESLVLAAVGGGAGVLLASWLVHALVAAAPPTLPRLESIGLDGWSVAFAAVLSLGTGLLFGLAPALHAAGPNLFLMLTDGGRAGTAGRQRQRLRRGLVVAQIGLALVLLVGAGLLIQSFARLRGVDPGFVPNGLLTARLELSPVRYPRNDQIRAFYEELVRRLEQVPGVAAVATVKALPMTQLELGDWSFVEEGRHSLPPRPADWVLANWQAVSPGYFETMRIPMLQGRDVAAADRVGAPGVAIVNRTLARRAWPGGDALGKRILLGGGASDSVWRTVIGVAGDVRHRGLDVEPQPEIYLPHAQFPAGTGTALRTLRLVLRSERDPVALTSAVRAAVASLDPDLPLAEVQTMEEAMGSWAAERRLTMLLVAGFAVVAIVLGGVGIYGVMAHMVAQRTREIGIRIAVGAVPREILALVLRQGAWLAGLGIAAGTLAGLGAARLLSGLLYGIAPTDLPTFLATAVLLAAVAAAASLLPAVRATRIDPIEALRAE